MLLFAYQANIRLIFLISTILVSLTGCWAVVVPATAPDSYHDINSREALIGTSIQNAIEVLGYPNKVLASNGNHYLIYKDYGGGLVVGFFLYAPFAVLPEDSDEGSIHCLLLEIDHDYLIRDIQLKTRGVGPTEMFTGSTKLPESCVRLFWDPGRRPSLHDTTEQTLETLKNQRKQLIQEGIANGKYSGDYFSAVKIVEQFGDTTPLEAILMDGGKESLNKLVSSIAERNNLHVYYKIREHNPELANKILCNAVEQGYCKAYTLIGAMYFTGYGIPPSKVNAYIYYKLAEKMKCADCCKNSIENIREWLTTEEISHAERLLNEWEIATCKIELNKSYNNKTIGK